MRLALTLMFLVCCSFAQVAPDFSGVYLRTSTKIRNQPIPATPRILEVHQTADELNLKAAQNYETATARYPLSNQKSDKLQVSFRGKSLHVKAAIVRQLGVPGSQGETMSSTEVVEEDWDLSEDGRQLTITRKSSIADRERVDTYTREPSWDAAAEASKVATRDGCAPETAPGSKEERLKSRKLDKGIALGFTFFRAITKCVIYDAAISGDFFKNLKSTKEQGAERFQKSGQPVDKYSGDILLEVAPHQIPCFGEAGEWVHTGNPMPNAVQDLRFMVRWLGTKEKDFGELPSEFFYEPWREFSYPAPYYRMHVPADDIPITDDLEVVIFASSGEELACLKGHL